jgi:hypothetical protein
MPKKSKYFDNDTRPVAPLKATGAEPIKPISTRRRYAHDFSAARQLKKIINSKGQPVWRRVPDTAIVFYGKQLSRRRATPGKSAFDSKNVRSNTYNKEE